MVTIIKMKKLKVISIDQNQIITYYHFLDLLQEKFRIFILKPEYIPDESKVFRRVHKLQIENNIPLPNAFAPKGDGNVC